MLEDTWQQALAILLYLPVYNHHLIVIPTTVILLNIRLNHMKLPLTYVKYSQMLAICKVQSNTENPHYYFLSVRDENLERL